MNLLKVVIAEAAAMPASVQACIARAAIVGYGDWYGRGRKPVSQERPGFLGPEDAPGVIAVKRANNSRLTRCGSGFRRLQMDVKKGGKWPYVVTSRNGSNSSAFTLILAAGRMGKTSCLN